MCDITWCTGHQTVNCQKKFLGIDPCFWWSIFVFSMIVLYCTVCSISLYVPIKPVVLPLENCSTHCRLLPETPHTLPPGPWERDFLYTAQHKLESDAWLSSQDVHGPRQSIVCMLPILDRWKSNWSDLYTIPKSIFKCPNIEALNFHSLQATWSLLHYGTWKN